MKYPKRSQYRYAKQKKYRTRNWCEYNEALRRRGDLTIWFDEEAIGKWKAKNSGKPGGQRVYSNMAIETGLVVRMIYKLGLRQTEGFLQSIALLELDARDQSILDYLVVEGLKVAQIADFFGVNRVTISKRLKTIRQLLLKRTWHKLAVTFRTEPAQLDSIIGLLQSRLDVTFTCLAGQQSDSH